MNQEIKDSPFERVLRKELAYAADVAREAINAFQMDGCGRPLYTRRTGNIFWENKRRIFKKGL